MTGLAKNQHYVPQFILKNFGSGANQQLHVIDKETRKTFVTAARNIASENGFYNFKFEDVDLSIEPLLSDLEEKVAPIIAKIVEVRSIQHLTDGEKVLLALFASVQFSRTRHSRDALMQIDRQLQDHVKKMGYSLEQVKDYTPLDEEKAKAASIHFLIKDAPTFAPHFLDKTWILMETITDKPFYISDHPITMHNHLQFGPYGNLGLGVRGIQIYFPISSGLSLAFYCSSLEKEFRENHEKHKKEKHLLPVKYQESLDEIEEILTCIEEGKPLKMNDENVRHMNSLQVRSAGRFVFSANGDFGLVNQMLDAGHGYLTLQLD